MAGRLIVLDRDGVINFDSPDFIRSAQEWRPLPGSISAIADLSKAGYQVHVATNQSGLGRGLFSRDSLERMHDKMRDLVAVHGGNIDGVYYCPHQPEDQCMCRKPQTGLLTAISEDTGISMRGNHLVGDSFRDLEAGAAMGCTLTLVLTGKGMKTREQLAKSGFEWAADVKIRPDLAAFAHQLLMQESVESGE